MVAPPFPLWAWLVFVGLVLALLFLDLFVLHRNAREVPFGEALWLSAFWIGVSLAFGGFVWFLAGADGAEARRGGTGLVATRKRPDAINGLAPPAGPCPTRRGRRESPSSRRGERRRARSRRPRWVW